MGYTPNDAVVHAHNIPHLDQSFSKQSNEFSLSMKYLISIVVFPASIGGIGIISIILFLLLLLFRCCCTCIKCGPKKINNNSDEVAHARWALNVNKWRLRILYGFIFFVLCTIFADHLVFFGNSQLNKGVKKTKDSLSILSDTFTTISNIISDISTQVTDINTSISASVCVQNAPGNYATDVTTSLDNVSTYTKGLSKIINGIPGILSNASKQLQHYGIDIKNLVVYIFYAFIFCIAGLHAFGGYSHKAWILKVAIFITVPVVIILTLICTINMIVIVSIVLLFIIILCSFIIHSFTYFLTLCFIRH